MRVAPLHLQGKGVLDAAAEISVPLSDKWNKESKSCRNTEPTSVLEPRRSPSPPTSTSTLSTSLGGGGGSGSTDTAGVAAVSDKPPPHKWMPSQGNSSPADGSGRKGEWASELQSLPVGLEVGSAGSVGEKCGGVGMEEWENMLSESAASPGNEQSFFKWFMGDMDDHSLKQLLQSGGGTSEFEASTGFGVIDSGGFGFEGGLNANAINTTSAPLSASATACGDFSYSGNGNSSSSGLVPSPNPTPVPNLKGTLLGSINGGNSPNPISPSATSLPLHMTLPLSLPPGTGTGTSTSAIYHQQHMESLEEKPQLFGPHLILNQQQVHPNQDPGFFLPLSYSQQEQQQKPLLLPPQPKRHQPTILDPSYQIPKAPFSDSGQELLFQRQQQQQNFSSVHLLSQHLQQRPAKPKVVVGGGDNANHHHHHHQQQQALVDQLFKAAELVETGNSVNARGILARLNHQLSNIGKPLQRAAFYFKEALQLLLNSGHNHPSASSASPLDVVFKISAYKVFSEISPVLQFANFTSNQALLEALDGSNRIHIVDFDIGIGGQWASFMQELALRTGGAPPLKITAFVSPSSHHPLELSLTRENLTHFANDLNISFEFNVINLDSIDFSTALSLPSSVFLNLSDNESVAVNFHVGSCNPPAPLLLRLVKQLSPKIVVSVDHGCERSEFSFSHHFLHALQSYSVLLDSLDAVYVNSDAVQKIERFLLLPRIENTVLGRHRAGEKMPPWRTLFASAGYSPLAFSNFTETQAECMLRRLQVQGFHVEKRQGQPSLYLCWQRGDLVSVSAWRC